MKINQLWQKHAIDLTQSNCIINSGQASCLSREGETWVGCHILNRYTTKDVAGKEMQSCFEHNQIQTDEIAVGRGFSKNESYAKSTWPLETLLL